VRVAAEVVAFCPYSLWQPDATWPYEEREATIDELGRLLVERHVRRLWFDQSGGDVSTRRLDDISTTSAPPAPPDRGVRLGATAGMVSRGY